MTKASLAGLIEFINAQPADRPANHETWATCAVGDYARSIGEAVVDSNQHGFRALKKCPVLKKLWSEAGSSNEDVVNDYRTVRETVDPTIMDVLNEAEYNVETYGKLREAIGAPLGR